MEIPTFDLHPLQPALAVDSQIGAPVQDSMVVEDRDISRFERAVHDQLRVFGLLQQIMQTAVINLDLVRGNQGCGGDAVVDTYTTQVAELIEANNGKFSYQVDIVGEMAAK